MTTSDLLRQHADVLFRTDAAGRLMAINEPDGEAPPRLFLARGRANHLVRFRSDVPPPTVEACLRIRWFASLSNPSRSRSTGRHGSRRCHRINLSVT